MKRLAELNLLSLLFTIAVLFSFPALSVAETGTWGLSTWMLEDGVLTISDGKGSAVSKLDPAPWYSYAEQINKVILRNVKLPRDCQRLFNGLNKVISITFESSCSFTEGSTVGSTGNVLKTDWMFAGCSSLQSVEGLGLFENTSPTSMQYMFAGCSALTVLDLTPFFVRERNSFDCSNLFEGCTGLQSVYLGNAIPGCTSDGTGSITLNRMFKDCKNLRSVYMAFSYPAGSQATPIQNMAGVFLNCNSLSEIDLSTWRANSGLTTDNLGDFFGGCEKLEKVTVNDTLPSILLPKSEICGHTNWLSVSSGKWVTDTASYTTGVYVKNPAAATFPEGTKLTGSWGECPWELDVDTGSLSIHNDTPKAGASTSGKSPWAAYAPLIRSVSFSGVILPMTSSYLFQELTKLTSVSFTNCTNDGVNVYYQNMFQGCTSLKELNLSGLPTQNVADVSHIFEDCSSLEDLTLPDFKHTLTKYSGAFIGCTSLQSVSYGAYFTMLNTGIPMEDSENRWGWYDENAREWIDSADRFPERSSANNTRYTFTKTGGPMTDLTTAEITLLPGETLQGEIGSYSAVYTGTEICPGVTVTQYGKSIDPILYTVSYEGNLHAGQASVSIAGNEKRHCSGSVTLANAFTIMPAQITEAMAHLESESFVYSGGAICPVPVVTFKGSPLNPVPADSAESGDLLLSWRNNMNVPSGGAEEPQPCAVLSTLKGSDFTVNDEIILSFSITPMPLSKTDVVFEDMEEIVWSGNKQIPSFRLRTKNPIPDDGQTITFQRLDEASQKGDYTVVVSDETDIGATPTLTVTFHGNFTGVVTQDFTILAALLQDLQSPEIETLTYTGRALEPAIPLSAQVNGHAQLLTPGEDYQIIEWKNNTDAWLAEHGYDNKKRPSVTLAGKGIFGGRVTIPFEIEARDLSEAEVILTEQIPLIQDPNNGILYITYNGQAHAPVPEVKLRLPSENDDSLYINPRHLTDFLCTYSLIGSTEEAAESVEDAGQYAIQVTAKEPGNFIGTAPQHPAFEIRPYPLGVKNIRFLGKNGDQLLPGEYAPVFTGGEILPKVAFDLDGTVIIPESPEDLERFCSIRAENNINAHNGNGDKAPTVTITGQGNFTTETEEGGALSFAFSITPCPVYQLSLHIPDIPDKVFNGQIHDPAVQVSGILPNGKEYEFRVSDKDGENDYSIDWENAIHAAQADAEQSPPAVVLSFHGNFDGELKKTFSILPLDLSAEGNKVTAGFPEESVYTGKEQKPEPSLSIITADGNHLLPQSGTDYTLSWENNIDAWQEGNTGPTPSVLVKGKGDYMGERRFPFSIARRSIEDATVQLVDDWLTIPETGLPSVAFDGKEHSPSPLVTVSIPGEDGSDSFTLTVPPGAFTVTCLKSREPEEPLSDWANYDGEVFVRVTANENSNFSGAAKAHPSFRIFVLSLADCDTLYLAIPGLTFIETGRAKTPEIHTGKVGTGILRQGTDFTVSYENNIHAGTAAATLTSILEPQVTRTLTFEIAPSGLSKAILPGSLRVLDSNALANCGFREIELPASCTSVRANAFAPESNQGIQSILMITIPNGSAEVDAEAFGCLSAFTLCAPESLKVGIGEHTVPVEAFCRKKGIYYERIPAEAAGTVPGR